MALRSDKAVEIFSALNLGQIKESEIEVREARSAIKELASNPNPINRYEIAQLMAYVVSNIINQKTNFLETIADVKSTSIGEKAMFKIKKNGIQAYIQAKNGTTARSKIMNAYTSIDTMEVSSRPYVNLYELAAGKVSFDEIINSASEEMVKKLVQNVEATLYAAFSGYSSPSYASGSGIVTGTLDPQIRSAMRFGNGVSLVGDINVVYKLAGATGFVTTTSVVQYSESVMNEFISNGVIGTYKGARVISLSNPFIASSLSDTVLRQDCLYIIPTGAEMPLKVVLEGGVESTEQTNMNDNTMEVCLRQYFGSAVISGDFPQIMVYEDTSL